VCVSECTLGLCCCLTVDVCTDAADVCCPIPCCKRACLAMCWLAAVFWLALQPPMDPVAVGTIQCMPVDVGSLNYASCVVCIGMCIAASRLSGHQHLHGAHCLCRCYTQQECSHRSAHRDLPSICALGLFVVCRGVAGSPSCVHVVPSACHVVLRVNSNGAKCSCSPSCFAVVAQYRLGGVFLLWGFLRHMSVPECLSVDHRWRSAGTSL